MPSCVNCGSENEEDIFCSNCGARIQDSVYQDSIKIIPQPVPNVFFNHQNKKHEIFTLNQSISYFYSKIMVYYIICLVSDFVFFYIFLIRPDIFSLDYSYITIFYAFGLLVIFQYFFKGDITSLQYQKRLLYLIVPTIHFLAISVFALIYINNLLIINVYMSIAVIIIISVEAIHIYIRISRFSSVKIHHYNYP